MDTTEYVNTTLDRGVKSKIVDMIEISSLSYIPGKVMDKIVGRVSLHFVKVTFITLYCLI